MSDFIAGRKVILEQLRRELVGPAPAGDYLACSPSSEVTFEDTSDMYKIWRQAETGEEILQIDNPCHRYGVGVLYPIGVLSEAEEIVTESGIDPSDVKLIEEALDEKAERMLMEMEGRADTSAVERETDDFGISTANRTMPSSMGGSFLVRLTKGAKLVVDVPKHSHCQGAIPQRVIVNGRYTPVTVRAADMERTWWLRIPISMQVEFTYEDLYLTDSRVIKGTVRHKDDLGPLDLSVDVYSREYDRDADCRLVTVCLVNRTVKKVEPLDPERCLFQSYFQVRVEQEGYDSVILPYPGPPMEKMDDEERSLKLLYRKSETYAVGHGCSANWSTPRDDGTVTWVSADCLPVYEVPSITPDITKEDGTRLEVSMQELAGLVEGRTGLDSLKEVIDEYSKWIRKQEEILRGLPDELKDVGEKHLSECQLALTRMNEGFQCLVDNSTEENRMIAHAFRLANHAMYLQQTRGSRTVRKLQYDSGSQSLVLSEPFEPMLSRGKWRAFQIAFILMSLRSVADGRDPFRDTVELIWFPTGGGKTEAYLGLAAFSIFLRRLRDKTDVGVNVIMRYTLRLLTSQQFQRACGLICAMEYLRSRQPDVLGEKEISIGLWLGSTFTPNTRRAALSALSELKRDPRERNPFVLRKCPWCNAHMGVIDSPTTRRQRGRKGQPSGLPTVYGYKESQGTVILHCTDMTCHFSNRLPVYLIDEDIYEVRPDLILGTVDKFAMLTWRSEARGIFGIDLAGNRIASPPSLIIQDELHLISGPLGSVVGLYEVLIDELCSDSRSGRAIRPKIVCATATIRKYAEQVKALYRRESVKLFPPSGLDVSDSFFSRYARDSNGQPMPGKLYVGVCGLGFTSAQTAQVRTMAALLQAPMVLSPEERDPWWTNLSFFNSIRELGGTISLLQSDIPNYLRAMWRRYGTERENRRYLSSFKELTSRLRDDEIPKAIEELELPYGQETPAVDCCLASNIIEVGVDIDRLSLMTVLGQPKSTSQYIQVTGRVGRLWRERPGVVVTIYYPNRPRDKSHFEKFRSFHQSLYAQVEPTSVTPYSVPVIERVLHGVMVAYVRQCGGPDVQRSPYPFPQDLVIRFRDTLVKASNHLNEKEREHLLQIFEKRVKEWRGWERTIWESYRSDSEIPLLFLAGSYVNRTWDGLSWPTMMSMRNVDAESRLTISNLYLREDR